MEKLSIIILTKNNENTISYALESSKFADEIIVIDSGSSDKTLDIVKSFDVRLIEQEWLGYSKQKQLGVDLAKNDWVLVLDSDEEITNALKEEIKNTLVNPKKDGYYVPRKNIYFGKMLNYGLYPDRHIRLFNKTKGSFNGRDVHESVKIDGKVGYLKNYMIHYAYTTIDECIDKFNEYSTLGAKNNLFKRLISPNWIFFKMYILKLGFLDGWHGFITAKLYKEYTFWKYTKADKRFQTNFKKEVK